MPRGTLRHRASGIGATRADHSAVNTLGIYLMLHKVDGGVGATQSRPGLVADHFDVVPVRIDDESCVVVRVVFRAQARRTVVPGARLQSCAIEGIDLLASLGHERDMKM